MSRPDRIDVVSDPARAAVVLHPLRLRILEALGEPGSATTLARALGAPRQRVNYHLRQLEENGFVALVEERRRGNCTERIFRAVARSYMLDPSSLGSLARRPEEVRDRFSSAYLMALAGESIRELGVLRERADRAGKQLPTFALQTEVTFENASDLAAFTEDLGVALAGVVDKYHRPGAPDARRFKLNLLSYPVITKEGEESS